MALIRFNYYLHDDSTSSERIKTTADKLIHDDPCALGVKMDEGQLTHSGREQLGELLDRPFYEVALDCQLDTGTGHVTTLQIQ